MRNRLPFQEEWEPILCSNFPAFPHTPRFIPFQLCLLIKDITEIRTDYLSLDFRNKMKKRALAGGISTLVSVQIPFPSPSALYILRIGRMKFASIEGSDKFLRISSYVPKMKSVGRNSQWLQ
jgi:hypothetical protein